MCEKLTPGLQMKDRFTGDNSCRPFFTEGLSKIIAYCETPMFEKLQPSYSFSPRLITTECASVTTNSRHLSTYPTPASSHKTSFYRERSPYMDIEFHSIESELHSIESEPQ